MKIYNQRFWTFGGWFTWAAAAVFVGAAGVGTALYGANKQAQAIKDTNAANSASVAAADKSNWNNYLLQRGLNTNGTAATGMIPSGAAPVNTKLPLWANINLPPAMAQAPGASPSGMAGPLVVRRRT